jgi:FkbM family methyltransferase
MPDLRCALCCEHVHGRRTSRCAIVSLTTGAGVRVSPSIDDYRSGRRFILCDLICGADLLRTPIVVIDVGAHDAFADPRWTKLPSDKIRVHGFEPDEQECRTLNEAAESAGLDFHFYPVALAGHTGPAEFYRYAEPAANSFYGPNEPLLSRWCYNRALPLTSQFKVLEKSPVEALSLADWADGNGIKDFDFIKLNVQGAELDVLRGAGPLLDTAMGMVVEQTFTPTYLGAPLFGKVYDFIDESGFCMFDVVGMNRVARTRSPIHITEDRVFVVTGLWPHHQFFEGHFFYMRDPLRICNEWSESQSPSLDKCFKLACVAEVFGQIEYAFEILEWIASSPSAARVAPATRKVIEEGAETYRKASAGPVVISDDQVLASMCTSAVPSAAQLKALLAKSRTDLAALQDRHDAALLEKAAANTSLKAIYESRSWKVTQPLRSLLNWIRQRA